MSSLGDLIPPRLSQALESRIADHDDVLLIVDALDEGASHAAVLDLINTLGWSVMVTTRPAASYSGQLHLDPHNPLHTKAVLDELKYPGQVVTFVSAWFSESCERAVAVNAQLKQSASLQKAASSPLLLTFFCLLGADDLTADVDVLLDRTLRRLLASVWREDPADEWLRVDRCMQTLEDLAWQTAIGETTEAFGTWAPHVTLTQEVFGRHSREDIKALGNVIPPTALIDFDTGFAPRRFLHRALQEHLLAKRMSRSSVHDLAEVVRDHCWAAPDWAEVLPAAVRRHEDRLAVVEAILSLQPFRTADAPSDIVRLDLDFRLRDVVLGAACCTGPDLASARLRAYVRHLRISHDTPAKFAIQTSGWGVPDELSAAELSELLVPRTGSTISNDGCGIPWMSLERHQAA